MRCLRLLALLVIVAGCSAEEPRSPSSSLVRSEEHRFTYQLPAGWERAAQSLTPNLRDPVEILAAGTVQGMRAGGGDCAHMPVGAIERMASSDVLVAVMERYGESTAPVRPARFALSGKQERSDATECAHGEPPLDVYWFDFEDERRRFYVLVALGREAPAERRSQALALLDSMRFEPGPEGVQLDRSVPFRDASARLSWQMPLMPWRRYEGPLTSVEGPVERLMLGTFGLEPAPPDADCTPQAALDALPPDGAFIYVMEYGGAVDRTEGFPERTGVLELGPERTYECIGPSRAVRWRDAGRTFQAHVVLGPRASDARLDEARSILNSILAY